VDDPVTAAERSEALVERLLGDALGAVGLLNLYVGLRLGLYRALADGGPLTSAELAGAAGVHERYAREWLEQQAVNGILEVDDPAADAAARRFSLPAGHDEVLLDEDSLSYMAPMAQLLVACVRPLDALLDAFRTGGGVPYADYGTDLHEGQAAFTRPLYDRLLGGEWLPAIPAVHARLSADPPARVADLACGQGRSTVAIARAYRAARVDGIDLDAASIARARELLAASPDVHGRVEFHLADAADPSLAGRYDLVLVCEALHDMSYPVDVLRAARGLLADGGVMLVVDEKVADEFALPAEDTEKLCYGFSVLHCLPVGMVGRDAAGTGTVMRAPTLRRYAGEAGFSEFEVLPVATDLFRFYLLTP
jgi:SAM-dependent methyltransferase